MGVVAALYRDVRSAERHAVALDGTLRDPEWQPFDVIVEELSSTGFRVSATAGVEVGASISLGLPGVGMCPARVVRHVDGQSGCSFVTPLSGDQVDAALHATSAKPVAFASLGRLPAPAAVMDDPAGVSMSGPVRALVIAGLAVAAWTATIAAASVLLG